MISGISNVIVKLEPDKGEMMLSISSLYDLYGDKEIEIYHKGTFYKGCFTKHNSPKEELYRINTGNSFIDISGSSEIETSKGIKKVSDLKVTDLIACYEEDEDFSNNNKEAYKSIYSIIPIKNDGYPLFSCSSEFTLANNIIIGVNE